MKHVKVKVPLLSIPQQNDRLSNEMDHDEITAGFLAHHTGVADLSSVTDLTLQVDSTLQRVSEISTFLINLVTLRLDNSRLESLRTLGSGMRFLKVLYASRCDLVDLSGLTTLEQLEELYVSFNRIATLDGLAGHESLSVLDLEGNDIQHRAEVQFIGMSRVKDVVLSGNPVSDSLHRRDLIQATWQDGIPVGAFLDYEPVEHDTVCKECLQGHLCVKDPLRTGLPLQLSPASPSDADLLEALRRKAPDFVPSTARAKLSTGRTTTGSDRRFEPLGSSSEDEADDTELRSCKIPGEFTARGGALNAIRERRSKKIPSACVVGLKGLRALRGIAAGDRTIIQ